MTLGQQFLDNVHRTDFLERPQLCGKSGKEHVKNIAMFRAFGYSSGHQPSQDFSEYKGWAGWYLLF